MLEVHSKVKLLGVHIDNKLNFNNYIKIICERAGKQLNVFKRLSGMLDEATEETIY